MSKEETCPLCLRPITTKALTLNGCGHNICVECLSDHINRSQDVGNQPSCPVGSACDTMLTDFDIRAVNKLTPSTPSKHSHPPSSPHLSEHHSADSNSPTNNSETSSSSPTEHDRQNLLRSSDSPLPKAPHDGNRQRRSMYPCDLKSPEHKDWIPDEASDFCSKCKSEFSFFNRRHHCRFCGSLLCADCCPPSFDDFPRRCIECSDIELLDPAQGHLRYEL